MGPVQSAFVFYEQGLDTECLCSLDVLTSVIYEERFLGCGLLTIEHHLEYLG